MVLGLPFKSACIVSHTFSFSGCKIFRDAVFVRAHAERVDGLCGILLWQNSADIEMLEATVNAVITYCVLIY